MYSLLQKMITIQITYNYYTQSLNSETTNATMSEVNTMSYFERVFEAEGMVYEGEKKNGKRHGKGKITYQNGSVYDGEWEDDMRHGFGTETRDGKVIYTGMWKNNMREGEGTVYYTDCGVEVWYKGMWKEGMQHGKGESICAGRVVYSGEWRCGDKHGYGMMTYPNGDMCEGKWEHGVKIK